MKKIGLYTVANSQELIMYHYSQFYIYYHPVGSQKLPTLEQFTPKKLANTTNHNLFLEDQFTSILLAYSLKSNQKESRTNMVDQEGRAVSPIESLDSLTSSCI